MSAQTLGEVAFVAYSNELGGTTHDGRPIPDWADVGDRVRAGWKASAVAALSAAVAGDGPMDGAWSRGTRDAVDAIERRLGLLVTAVDDELDAELLALAGGVLVQSLAAVCSSLADVASAVREGPA